MDEILGVEVQKYTKDLNLDNKQLTQLPIKILQTCGFMKVLLITLKAYF